MERSGTILILVAGISALLLSLSLAFLLSMRNDAEESQIVLREAQAHLMLQSACAYVQETSRLGWDDPATAQHEEGYGWVDVRDGEAGPKVEDWDELGQPAANRFMSAALVEDSDNSGSADRPAWPAIGGVARCPMYVMKRPPSAISPAMARNPINTDVNAVDFGFPYLRNPDPQPAIANGWPTLVTSANWNSFKHGDRTPYGPSTGKSWFRVYRKTAARFIVTCGGGGSQGFKDWNEVLGMGAQEQFGNDSSWFRELAVRESRLWYEIEWSAFVAQQGTNGGTWGGGINWEPSPGTSPQRIYADTYGWPGFNSSHNWSSQPGGRNMAGTIRWIQRLDDMPAAW